MTAQPAAGRTASSVLAGRYVLLAGVFLLPVIFWPALPQPFSTPKLWLLAIAGGAACMCALAQRGNASGTEWPWLIWPVAASVSALFAPDVSLRALSLALLPLPMCWAAWRVRLPARSLAVTLAAASTVVAVIAVLQYCGADPLRLTGWRPESFENPRMRVYGTLGNPNFVAAWLCATIPLFSAVLGHEDRCSRAQRIAWWAAFLVQLAAIAATGSRVFLLAAPVAAAVLIWRGSKLRIWWLAVLPAAAAVLWFSPARALGTTIEGRLYLSRIAAAHLAEVPPAGFGPGTFEPRFAQWQVEWLRNGGAAGHARAFAGEADHAHNDFIELWVEYGPIGFLAFAAASVWLVIRGLRVPRGGAPHKAAALAGAAAIAAIAAVDFPFHRPAEWALYWLLLATHAEGGTED